MGFIKRVERELLFRKNLSLFEEKLPPVAQKDFVEAFHQEEALSFTQTF